MSPDGPFSFVFEAQYSTLCCVTVKLMFGQWAFPLRVLAARLQFEGES
jgi:hypothetical protein